MVEDCCAVCKIETNKVLRHLRKVFLLFSVDYESYSDRITVVCLTYFFKRRNLRNARVVVHIKAQS